MEGGADEYWRQARETVEEELAIERTDLEGGAGSIR
jgi:hypothetical protein